MNINSNHIINNIIFFYINININNIIIMYQQPYRQPYVPQYMQPAPIQQNIQPAPEQGSGNIWYALIIALFIYLIYFRKNGTFSEWSEYTACDKPCGGGHQKRTRTYTPAQFGGKEATDKDKLEEVQECNKDVCVINGKMSAWKDNTGKCVIRDDSTTEITCGTGKKQQTRSYIPGSNGGIELSIESDDRKLITQWVACKKEECKVQNDDVTDWIYDGNCVIDENSTTVKTCGTGGKQKQTRTYIPAKGTGTRNHGSDPLVRWVDCKDILSDCPGRADGICSDYIYSSTGCVCNSNGVYQTTKSRKYTPPVNGGSPVDCDISSVSVRCDSNVTGAPAGSTYGAKCPSSALLGTFADGTCTPAEGRNRKKPSTVSYTFPIGPAASYPHATGFTSLFSTNDITDIGSLTNNTSKEYTNKTNSLEKITVKRTNNTIPQTYTITKQIGCDDVPNWTTAKIQDIWANVVNCTTTFSTLNDTATGTSSGDLQYGDRTFIDSKFNRFTKSEIMAKKYITDDLKTCYGNSSLIISRDDLYNSNSQYKYGLSSIPNKIPIGISFTNAKGNVIIAKSTNGMFELHFLTTGVIALIGNGKSLILNNSEENRESGTWGGGGVVLSLQWGGNLVLYSTSGSALWASSNGNDQVKSLLVSNCGNVMLLDVNNNSVQQIHNNTKWYLQTVFYDNCPVWLFTDKAGRVWKALTSVFGDEWPITSLASDSSGASDVGGTRIASDHPSFWNVTQRNLNSIYGYNTELNQDKPVSSASDAYNYNSSNDRKAFYDNYRTADNGTKTYINIKKPLQIAYGGDSWTNYIPGYDIVSYITDSSRADRAYRFLLSITITASRNQFYPLYHKIMDRTAFANSIVSNHPDLANLIGGNKD